MAESSGLWGGAGFVGRAAELAVVRTATADTPSRGAAVVWIEGEAGTGKTALVAKVTAELSAASPVLRMAGDEHCLDRPFFVARQVGVDGADGPFAAGLSLLDRFGQNQGSGPTVVVVEDMHWVDRGSRLALLTAARRLDRDAVVILVTSRPDASGDDGWDRFCVENAQCRRLVLAGLGPDDVAEMGRQAGVSLTAKAAGRLHAHTNGHPLYVQTLLREVPQARLVALDGELPVPRSLEATIVARLAELPAEGRRLAEALSVIGEPVPLSVAGQVAGLARPAGGLDDLLATGWVTWEPGEPQAPVAFAHPLYRAALYRDLSPTRRRNLHAAAAQMLAAGSSLAHRVAAADGVDDRLATELADRAGQEKRGGARALAARYLMWASSLGSDRPVAEHRLLDACRLWVADGQVSRVADLRGRLESCQDSPRRSLVLGMLAWEQGESAVAEQYVLEAAGRLDGDAKDPVALAAIIQLGTIYSTLGRGREAMEAGHRALSLRPLDAESERAAWLILAVGEASVRGAPAGLARLAERLPQPADAIAAPDADLLIVRGTLGFYAGRITSAVTDLRAAIRLARQGAAAAQLPRAHLQLAQLLLGFGEWDDAMVHADVALSLVSDRQRIWMEAQAHAALGRLFADRGQWGPAAEHVAAANAAAANLGTAEAVFTARIAEAAVARAAADPGRIVTVLAPLVRDDRAIPMATSLAWWPTLISALIDCGRLDEAATHIGRLERAAEQRGLDLTARIIGGRAQLSLANGDAGPATAGLAEAVGLLGPDDPLLDRATLHHALGRVLLAQGRRRAALDELHAAHDLLAPVAAEPFLRRVEADLAAAGITPARQGSHSALDLTERERDVVALVAKGLTNREVAAELYIGDKTVEYHLRNVFGKLGVTSRRQLRAYLSKS